MTRTIAHLDVAGLGVLEHIDIVLDRVVFRLGARGRSVSCYQSVKN
jgi:hypothetical protein